MKQLLLCALMALCMCSCMSARTSSLYGEWESNDCTLTMSEDNTFESVFRYPVYGSCSGELVRYDELVTSGEFEIEQMSTDGDMYLLRLFNRTSGGISIEGEVYWTITIDGRYMSISQDYGNNFGVITTTYKK